MHFHNSVLHYLHTMADGLVIHVKARSFKAKVTNSRPRSRPGNYAKAKKLGLKAKED